MRTYFARICTLSTFSFFTLLWTAAAATWTGGGNDDFWSTPANWGGTAVSPGDALLFGGSTRTSPNNDFPAGTTFERIQIFGPAGAFTLRGNGIRLSGNIGDDQPLVPQVIQFPITVNVSPTITVARDGSLTLSGVISGTGVTLTKNGDGQLTLGAVNSFDGAVVIQGGALAVSADRNLGLAPGSPTAGSIKFDDGTLRATASFTLNPDRGILLVPIEGSGSGKITVNSGSTLTYGGVIANNGGTGGLTKNAFGTLTLSGANTYSGPTILQNGTIILDFTAAGAPANNIISSSSALRLGGESAGLGTLSYAALTLNGKNGANNSQSFNSTTIDIGPAIIRANSIVGGPPSSANLSLGPLSHYPGAAAAFIPPSATGTGGNITTPSPNINGILGGWAVFSDGSTPVGNVTIGQNWASVNGSGNIVSYNAYTDYAGGDLRGSIASSANLRLTAGSHPGGAAVVVRVDAENAGTLTDVNSIALQPAVPGDTFVIGTGNKLRLGRYGGIFRQDTTGNPVWYIGGSSGPQSGTGTVGSQGIGSLTAGGADNTEGEIVFTINAPNQTSGSCVVESTITDNGSGKVTVVKTGPGSMKLDGHNTYSGGLYVLQGRLQFAGTEVGTANPDGGGTGPIYVGPGGQLYPSGAGGTITNELFLAGLGGGAFSSGALRMSSNPQTLAGQVNLIGDVFICGGGTANTNGHITGKITGNFSFGVGQSGGGENITTYFRI
ncbi:MAG TPA: autotransporter-associated beta strand repeat-containing protein, partial [Verrucomicrobiae bacterium]|nr:autotransporter-associated beta strand repeat-containing protein [Verrucomicrobiae bacterium]